MDICAYSTRPDGEQDRRAATWREPGFAGALTLGVVASLLLAATPSVAVTDLRPLCPTPLDRVSTACASALERHYMPERVVDQLHSYPGGEPRGWWSPLPVRRRIVWLDLFDDPEALRKRVDIALERPECLVSAGRIRHDLQATCDADAMNKLALLLEACVPLREAGSGPRNWREEWQWEFEAAAADSSEGVPGEELLAESVLHFVWRLRRCNGVSPAVFAVIDGLPGPWRHYPLSDQGQAHHLQLAAARLGDVWASVRSVGGEADITAAATADLVVGYVRRAGYAYILSSRATGASLAYLLAAQALDLRRDQPVYGWTGMREAFTAFEIGAAQPVADRILAGGWVPLERTTVDAGPKPRRWIGEDGLERVQHEGEAVMIVTGDGFLSRCGRAGRQLGFVPTPGAVEEAAPGDAGTLAGARDATPRHDAIETTVRRWVGEDGDECAIAADGTVLDARGGR